MCTLGLTRLSPAVDTLHWRTFLALILSHGMILHTLLPWYVCAELLHEQTDASLSQLLVAPVSMSDCLLTGSSVYFDCFPTCCQGPPLICLFGCAQGWVCLQMDSYSFNFPNDGDEILRVQLVPLLDLINHGDDPNIALSRDQDSSSYVATALRPIR